MHNNCKAPRAPTSRRLKKLTYICFAVMWGIEVKHCHAFSFDFGTTGGWNVDIDMAVPLPEEPLRNTCKMIPFFIPL